MIGCDVIHDVIHGLGSFKEKNRKTRNFHPGSEPGAPDFENFRKFSKFFRNFFLSLRFNFFLISENFRKFFEKKIFFTKILDNLKTKKDKIKFCKKQVF